MEDLTQEEYDRKYNLLTKPATPADNGTPHVTVQNITAEKLQKLLPKKSHKTAVTSRVMELIRNMEKDTGMLQEYMEEKVLVNLHQLNKVGCTLEAYINAVKFCTLKQNMALTKAWAITFPNRYKILCDRAEKQGKVPNISNYSSAYDRGAIVCAVTADMLVEFSIQYAPARHAAMRKLIDLMAGKSANPDVKVSPTVQMNSAIAVLDKTEMPADNTVQLKIGMDDESKGIQQSLAAQMARNAEIQLAALKEGKSLDEIQRLGLSTEVIEAEVE